MEGSYGTPGVPGCDGTYITLHIHNYTFKLNDIATLCGQIKGLTVLYTNIKCQQVASYSIVVG